MASSQLPEPASMQSASQKHEPSVNREHHCISELFSDGSEQEMEVEEKEEPMAINDTARTPNSNNAQGPAPRSITAKSSESSRVKHFVDTFREYNVDKLHAIGQELHDRLPAMELFRVAVLQQGLPALGQHKSLQSLAKAKQIFEQWLRFYKNQKRSRDSVFITAILLVLISETYEQLVRFHMNAEQYLKSHLPRYCFDILCSLCYLELFEMSPRLDSKMAKTIRDTSYSSGE
jgi:hypothetical protein